MKFDEHTKLTDSLERILIEREANEMRGAAFAAMGRSVAVRLGRLGLGAAAILRFPRDRAKDAKVDYAAS